MQDPKPENIDGSKLETHEFKHTIDWGHVAIAVALIAVVYVASQALRSGGSSEEEDGGLQ